MKKFLVCTAVFGALGVTSAAAADVPVKSPAYEAPLAAAPSWTGLYIGGNIGFGLDQRRINSISANDPTTAQVFAAAGGPPPLASFRSSGVIAGPQLGLNLQFSRSWLVGIETDFNWSGIEGSSSTTFTYFGVSPFVSTYDEKIKWFGTARARLGYLPTDNLLAYITGGFAYGRVQRAGSIRNNSTQPVSLGAVCNSGATCTEGQSSSTASGWTLGGGLEYSRWQNWSLKAEYLYVNLGGGKSITEFFFNSGVPPQSFNASYSSTSIHVARLGVNYRF